MITPITPAGIKLGLKVGLGLTLLASLYLTSLYNYLLFHSLVELFSIVVACGIFMFAWNSRRFMANDYLLFLGLAYLFVAIIDLVHTLAYKGMNIFASYGADLSTQLWIAARYVESLSFLTAAFFFTRKVRPYALCGAYSLVVGLLLALIFGGVFPVCYVDGSGLTVFKKVSEYVISVLFLVSIYLIFRQRRQFHTRVYWLLVGSLVLTIGSELAFTFYVSVYGLSNLIGHFFKLVSFYLIYAAVIATGLREPYDLLFKQLEDSRQNLERRVQARTADLEQRRLELGKRVRELACLYDISDLIQKDEVLGEDILQGAVNLIPSGWQTPDDTCARLIVDGRTFLTPNWAETDRRQVSPIVVHGQPIGTLEVRRLTERFSGDAVPFLRQEQSLLDAIAGQLGRFIESQRAREELRASEEKYRLLVEESPLGLVIITPEGKLEYISPSFVEMFGYTLDEVPTGRDWLRHTHPVLDSRREVASAWPSDLEDLKPGEEAPRTFTVSCRNGSEKVINFRAVPMHNGKQFLLCEDVTEHELLERQFQQAQKMEAVGRLAGGVAHDFNNLLTIITGYCDMALEKLDPDDPLFQDVTQINEAGRRAADLTRQLLAFSRRQVLQLMPLDLGTILSDLETMLRRMIREDIELVTHAEAGLGTVMADPGQIEQVIMNLAVNARDAMPDGGKLTIEAGNVILDEPYARSHPEARVGPHVMLAVTDTGIGMDEPTRTRIFEPFFTTKEKSQGTGLGLATVYGIVKQSGGNIFVYSEPGRGTTFKVYFPRVDEAAVSLKADRPEDEVFGGTEAILVVEDEAGVRKLICRVLRDRGYRVEEAADGEEALALAAGQEFQLLLTDVVMPGLSGPELARRLTAGHPGIKVLYTSGYTDDSVVRNGLLEPGVQLITKPLSPVALARKVREVLDAGKNDQDSHKNGRHRS